MKKDLKSSLTDFLKKNTEELEVTKKKESSTKVEGKVIDKPLLLEDGRQLLI